MISQECGLVDTKSLADIRGVRRDLETRRFSGSSGLCVLLQRTQKYFKQSSQKIT